MPSLVRRTVVFAAIAAASVATGALVPSTEWLRPLFAAGVAVLLVNVGLRAPHVLIIGLLPWLVAVGTLRRVLAPFSPARAGGDPLLLVGAVAWMIVAMTAFRRGALTGRTPLANAVLALTLALIASAVNPAQGSLLVGLGGILLVVVPMLAFWVGRKILDERTVAVVIRVIAFLAILSAIYGLAQSFVGLPPWDQRWVATTERDGYTAINVVTGIPRAFGSFSAASEYATFLALGLVSLIARIRKLRVLPFVLGPVILIAVALWFESSRGVVVLSVAALALMLCASRGVELGRSLVVGAALVATIPLAITHFAPNQFDGTSSAQLTAHQVEGLSDPFGKTSTLPGHISRVVYGLGEGFSNPIGRGVGSITIAAGKYGGTQSGTEGDPGNAGIAAGLLGVLAYLAVLVLGVRAAYSLARTRRDAISLAALGLIVVTFLQWLNGGQYAVAFVPWLMLGWVDATTVAQSA